MKNIFQSIGLLGVAFAFLFGGCQEDPIELTLTGSIRGWVVTEAYDSLEHVILTTNPATESTVTDSSGAFFLENIPVGDYTIRANREGYREKVASTVVVEDEVSEVFIVLARIPNENVPPEAPFNPDPADGATGLPLTIDLSWETFDQNERDTLRYRIKLFSDAAPEPVEIDLDPDTTHYRLQNLSYDTEYRWQVIVDDGHASPVYGETWTFRTRPFPDLPINFVRKVNGKYAIFSTNRDTVPLVQLTDAAQDCWRPRMSPLRDKIAFLAFVDGDVHLFTMDRDGDQVRRITPDGYPLEGYKPFELDFCWSPQGDRLFYMSSGKLYSINRDGTGLTELATAPGGQSWVEIDVPEAGNGDWIAARTRSSLSYTSRIYILRGEDGFVPQLLLDDVPGTTGGPALYITGEKMLITLDEAGHEEPSGRQLDARIKVLQVNNGQTTDLSQDKGIGTNDLDPRYDPTGAEIIFVNAPNTINPGQKDLWITDVNGNSRYHLIKNGEMPDWR